MTMTQNELLTDTNIMATKKAAVGSVEIKESNIQYASHDDLIFNSENIRDDIDRPELLEQLLNDGRILTPLIVYPESFNIDGKKVVFEGNCRLHAIQKIVREANNNEYPEELANRIPYTYLPEDIAGDKLKERLFQISLGTTNKQLSSLEQAKAYKAIVDEHIADAIAKDEAFAELDDKKQGTRRKKFRKAAIDSLIEATGKSERYFHILLESIERADSNPEIANALNSNIITPIFTERLSQVAEKNGVKLDKALNLAKKAMHQTDSNTIAQKVIDLVDSALAQSEEVIELVEKDALPFNLVNKAVESAKEAKTDIIGLVSEASDIASGTITAEDIDKAKIAIASQPSDFLDDEEDLEISESLDEIEDTEEDIQAKLDEAIDNLGEFSLWLANLTTKEFEGLTDRQVIELSDKLTKIQIKIEKELSKDKAEQIQ
jgi:hypothetical protein